MTTPADNKPLSHTRILEVATDLLISRGTNAVTARKLATGLGVSQMAIYRYFDTMDALRGELVNHLIDPKPIRTQAGESWEGWAMRVFTKVRKQLLEVPGLLPMLGNPHFVGHNAIAFVEYAIQALNDAGFSREAAATAFHTLLAYTMGACGIQSVATGGVSGSDNVSDSVREMLSGASAQGFDAVAEHAEELSTFASDTRFELGLRAIIKGLEISPE